MKKEINQQEKDCPFCEISEGAVNNLKSNLNSGIKKKYISRKKEKEQRRLQKEGQRKIKKTIIISLLLILVVGGITWGSVNYFLQAKEEIHLGIPQIEINPLEYDAGIVSMNDELVKYTFEIKNKGVGDLELNEIWTSCMCTTARLRVNNKVSPEFGMHDNPKFWSQKIAPGETGYLEVVFDQAFHGPAGTGEIIRVIYLSSNDPENGEVGIKLLAKVID